MSDKERNFVIRLVVGHESLSLKELSEILARVPTIGYSAGEARKTPAGRLLQGTYTLSLWGISVDYFQTKNIFQSAMELIYDMEARGADFNKLKEVGAKINLNIDVFSDSSVASVLRTPELEVLYLRGIEIGLEIFRRS